MANKYRSRPTGGYASAKESRRATELKLLVKAGKIEALQEQVPFELIPVQRMGGKVMERAVKYYADFAYHGPDGYIVEDVKSPASRTAEYIIKRKLMLHVHGIRILET